MPISTQQFMAKSAEIHKNGTGKEVTLTSGQHFYDGLNGHVIVLDQNNEMGIVMRPTSSQYAQKDCRFEVTTFPYSDISFVSSFQDMEGLENTIDFLCKNNVIAEEDKESIIKQVRQPIDEAEEDYK